VQQQYLSGLNTTAEEKEQGFVTMHHNLEKLHRLHALATSVIIKGSEIVIAYAFVMLTQAGSLIPELKSMFEKLESLSWNDKPLQQYRYYVMGQVCVDKPYRGQGVFQMLYDKHKELMQPHYDFLVTEIATRNTRRIRAHEKVGFELLHRFSDEKEEWDIVVWDWS
jgi:GNAT superfamily N-acetyltransferase